jgi:PAS domain-containing protein
MALDPLNLLFAAALTGFLVCIGLWTLVKNRKGSPKAVDLDPKAHVFTFENRDLIAASPVARDALNVEDLDEDIYNQMIYRLSDVFPTLEDTVMRNEESREDFTLKDVSVDGPISISFAFDAKLITVTIRGLAAPLSRKMILDRDQALAADAELRTLRGTVETAPFPMWRENATGTIDWVNRAYLTLLDKADHANENGSWPPPRLFETGVVVKMGESPVPARKMLSHKDGSSHWFDTTGFGIGENSLHFAVNANATARAEESQRNFLQTLTQTFSYLPTGLAIFDAKRQLVLFNPALTDLTGLEPAWLVMRPTLHDFLNHLREKRILPEQKNFTDWRSRITALERSANDGTYCGTWALPTGQTYRMTGRPHPEGAIAFLFEDITTEIALTRKFRRELELSQSVFDNLPEAIAVFGQDGTLTMTNTNYDALWGIDTEIALEQINVVDASRHWQSKAQPSPIWGDAREFILSVGERSDWSETVVLKDGRQIRCRFAPLAGHATLASFEETSVAFALPELRSHKTRSDEPVSQEVHAKSA